MAGTGKRAGQKKPTILTQYGNAYFGKHGFTSIKKLNSNKKSNIINLSTLSKFPSTTLNLTELGYTKLLGSGKVSQPYTITIAKHSQKAKQKIQEAGGMIQE